MFALWVGGAALLWLFYAFVFVETGASGWSEAIGLTFANVLPLALLAVATHKVLPGRVMPLPLPFQIMAHTLLAAAFAITWYATVLVLLAFVRGVGGGSFAVSGFPAPF